MFKHRSTQKELLDGEVTKADLIQNLKELHSINKLLGGYKISLDALSTLKLNSKTLVDVGCGGGDMLYAISQWAEEQNIAINLHGIDLKQDCIEYAKEHLPSHLNFIQDDFRKIKNHLPKVDILHACLFTHHLTNQEIIDLIVFAKFQNCILVINDLERNPLAYFSIKWLTRLFSKSHLVKHDAPLSVLRGFKKREWREMITEAGASRFHIKWKWAFRHQIIIHG